MNWRIVTGVALFGALLALARRSFGSKVSFREALLAAAQADLDVVEDLGKNDGDRIREYFAGSGITPPANWCAAAATTWIREAAQNLDRSVPIKGSMQAKVLMGQIQTISATDLRARPELVRPGMIVFWDRSDPKRPETSWWGHVGVVETEVDSEGDFGTIEANSGAVGDRVARMTRSISDPRLLAIGDADNPRASGAMLMRYAPSGPEQAPDEFDWGAVR